MGLEACMKMLMLCLGIWGALGNLRPIMKY